MFVKSSGQVDAHPSAATDHHVYQAVSSDGTVDREKGAQVVYVSPSAVQSSAKKIRENSIKKFSFGASSANHGKRWGATKPWTDVQAPPVPSCTVKQLAQSLEPRGVGVSAAARPFASPTIRNGAMTGVSNRRTTRSRESIASRIVRESPIDPADPAAWAAKRGCSLAQVARSVAPIDRTRSDGVSHCPVKAPPQLDPAPAVQPKQWSAVRIDAPARSANELTFQTVRDPPTTSSSSI